MAEPQKLREEIAAILEKADLDTITSKKIRKELETNLGVDLTAQRKEVDDLIMDALNKKQNRSESEEEESEEEVKTSSKRGAPKKRGASDSEEDFQPKAKKGSAAKAAAPKKAGGRGGTGFTKVCNLSPELAAVMGQPQMARHEVVKKMWSIIKEKNLYDPKNKQFAICNAELLPIIGTKRFRTFGMMKHLKNHIRD